MEQLTGNLPLNEDLRFQRHQAVFQRLGWCGVGIFLLAAMLGFLGPGFYSTRTVEVLGFALDYDRVIRRQAPGQITVRIKKPPASATLVIEIGNEYLQQISIQSIAPEPSAANLTRTGTAWIFPVAKNAPRAGQVHFQIRPETPGRVDALVTVDGESITLRQIVLP